MSSMDRLIEIMARLRDPENGCPWDLKQTYGTIVPHTLEEAYEVADAIEQGDFDELRGELGDLLFQVVFYSQIAREEGRFTFEEVAQGICDKMIRRHPHVFADQRFDTEEQLREAWESTKSAERQEKDQSVSSQMDGVTRALPALIRAEKLQKRAKRVGFDWPDVSGAIDKTREELIEVEEAIAEGDADHLEDELGDMLFAFVNIVRMLDMDAEKALRRANNKFEKRFRAMEQILADQGQGDLRELDLDTMESAWSQVKQEEKNTSDN